MPSILQDETAVRDAVARGNGVRDALQILGLRAAGGNYRYFYKACERFGIEPPKHDRRLSPRRVKKMSLDDILVENSTYTNRGLIKQRLLEAGLLEYHCYGMDCAVEGTWNGKPISLQLEHKNGVFNDHRLENLELLCPNCHSQTSTFAGRHK